MAGIDQGWMPVALSGQTVIAQNMTRMQALSNQATLTSGTLYLVAGLVLPKGQPVKGLAFFAGSTALSGGSNQWAGIFAPSARSGDACLTLALSTDQTSTAWAADTAKTFDFSSRFTPEADLPVYAGLCVVATTVPTLVGNTISKNAQELYLPRTRGTSTSGLTTPASCPSAVAHPGLALPAPLVMAY